jgi:hypothetical protein
MMIKSTLTVIAAIFAVFAVVGLVGEVLGRAQDAAASGELTPGFVPSTGQINLGFDPEVPSSAIARKIPSIVEARMAFFASERAMSTFDHNASSGAVSSEVDMIAPIAATPQTMPAKFSNTNDTLDRVPIIAWPLGLSDQQRQTIYSAVMADNYAPAMDAGNLGLTSELPTDVALSSMHPLPSSISEITRVRGLKYVKTKDKVLLVSPEIRIVVDEISG